MYVASPEERLLMFNRKRVPETIELIVAKGHKFVKSELLDDEWITTVGYELDFGKVSKSADTSECAMVEIAADTYFIDDDVHADYGNDDGGEGCMLPMSQFTHIMHALDALVDELADRLGHQ